MTARPDPSAPPFDVVVLVAPADAPEALAAALPDRPAPSAAVLVASSSPGGALEADRLGAPAPLSVRPAGHGAALRPGGVYVAPARHVLEVRPGGRCVLAPTDDPVAERPLDRLLGSLALSFGERALAVLLGGAGDDGVRGARALRGAGGTVLVRDPADDEAGDLPRAVIVAGAASAVLAPGEVGRAVADRLAGHAATWPPPSVEGIVERMGDAYCVLDRDFRIVRVNAAAERLLGMPRAALLGRTHWEAFPASVDAPVGRALRRVVQEGVEQHLTHHYTGEGYDLHLELDAYLTDEGGVAMFWRDVTARVRAEEEVRASEEKYRALFREMDEAYAIVEVLGEPGRWTDFLFVEVNPAFVRHTGLPDPVGRTATELLGTPNPRWAELYGRAVETGERVRVEEAEPTLGRVFDLNVFRLGGAGSRRVAVLFADITERRRAEDALVESERRYRLLFENMNEGFALAEVLRDDDGRPVDWRYVEVNGAWTQTGVPVADTVGRTAREVNPRIEPGWIETYGRVVDTGRPAAYEAYAAGFGKWFDTVAFKHSENRFGLIFRDVTARKRAEGLLRESEERQAFLLRLSDLLQRLTSPADIKTQATHMLGARLGVSRAQYHEVDGSGEYYSADGIGFADGLPLLDLKYRIGQFGRFVAEDFEAGRPFRSDDLLADPRPTAEEREAYGFYGIRAGAGTPLLRGGRLVAILAVHDRRPHAWTDLEMELIRETAERVWVAVEKVRAERAAREREERQAFLLRLGDALRTEPDVDAVANRALGMLAERLRLDRCFIAVYRLEEDRADFTHQVGNGRVPPGRSGTRPSDFPDALRVVFDSTLVIDDVALDQSLSDTDRQNMSGLGMGALVAATLRRGEGRPRWCVVAVSANARHWTPGEIALMEEVAERTWTAMERARAERALAESEGLLRALIEHLPGGAVFVVDHDLRYVLAQGEALAAAGFAPEDLVGRPVAQAVSPELVADHEARYRRTLAGEGFEAEHDAHGRAFLTRGVPLRNAQGFVYAALAVSYDITARRRAEEEVRTLNATLEERVAERTRRLADLNAELGNVITRTASNLEAPARRLGRLFDPGRPEGARAVDGLSPHDATALHDEVARLRGVAQDLRELARLEERHVEKELLPLRALFEEVRGPSSDAAGVEEVYWQIGPLPIVRGDGALLRQALAALVAFTLSETRGARYVAVSSREVEGEVRVTVEDDGVGLSGEEAATLFDLAVRTDQAVPVLEGSGLVQVRRVMARHGGWAWAEATRSGGKVVLAFPRDEAVTSLEALFRPGPSGQA